MSHSPKVSAIIHFLNAAQYLPQAIDSIFRQTFTDWELILVDGGSQDESVTIAESYQAKAPDRVRVLAHQGEQKLGIFSSRIWGAREASTPLLALLDSDDEWHPQFLERQYAIYQAQFSQTPGMVYCPVAYWWEDPLQANQGYVQPVPPPGLHTPPNLVVAFAEQGYQKSAANSAVLIAREAILDTATLIGTADEGAVEDQYLWSWILLKYPVFINPEPLVRYRQWSGSTCATTAAEGRSQRIRAKHLQWLLDYLTAHPEIDRQPELVQAVHQLIALESGATPSNPLPESEPLAAPSTKAQVHQFLKENLPANAYNRLQTVYATARSLYHAAKRESKELSQRTQQSFEVIQARSRLAYGIEPLSYLWGVDRGHSLLRYYLETQFLPEFAADIQGHCLEFQENSYTSWFGGDRVTKLDILHHEPGNPNATLIGDLTQPNDLPSNTFDCIICTYVLHVIPHVDRAIADLHRLLKAGGVLLIAVPHISMCDPDSGELWRFTPEGIRFLTTTVFAAADVTIRAYGNSLTAAGNIRGLVVEEFTQAELAQHDPRFASTICVRAVKR